LEETLLAANRKVVCFHERLAGYFDARRLLVLWQRSWDSFGWETQVLGMGHARAHPMFGEFDAHTRRFYSRNPGKYDSLCWLRWLAFAQAGGGVMTDYDTINRCLISQDIEPGAPVIHESTRVPCCVSADQGGADDIVSEILKLQPPPEAKRHFSDMMFFQASRYPHDMLCVELGHPGWETAKCVHFSRNAAHAWSRKTPFLTKREDLFRRLIPTFSPP